MSIFKGFIQIDILADNDRDAVSPVGEFSADSNTFVRDYSIHTHSDYPGLTLYGLSNYDVNLNQIEPTGSQLKECLEVSSWIHSKARSGQIGPSEASFRTLFEGEFNNRFTLMDNGSHVTVNNYWYPSSIAFAPVGDEDESRWTLWYSDAAFNNEFDESILIVVPPIENIDQFFNPKSTVEALVDSVSRTSIIDKINVERGIYPYTVLRMDGFDWVDPNNSTSTIKTYWNIVIYGRAGDNLDRVKEAIQDYVRDHSNRDFEEWGEIFPDIFKSTEFIVSPGFFNQAVPDQQFERGVYSSIGTTKDLYEVLTQVSKGPGYNNQYIRDRMVTIPSLYRAVSLGVITGPENKVGFETFRKVFWDFIDVPTTHPDFMRMRKSTRDFVLLLTEMVEYAEGLTPTSTVPIGFNRIEREGIWYLARSNDSFMTLVVSKYSIDKIANDLNLPSDEE